MKTDKGLISINVCSFCGIYKNKRLFFVVANDNRIVVT